MPVTLQYSVRMFCQLDFGDIPCPWDFGVNQRIEIEKKSNQTLQKHLRHNSSKTEIYENPMFYIGMCRKPQKPFKSSNDWGEN